MRAPLPAVILVTLALAAPPGCEREPASDRMGEPGPGEGPAPVRGDSEAVGAAIATLLASAAKQPEDSDSLVVALAAFGEPAIPSLVRALSEGGEGVRLVALEALGRIGGPAGEALTGTLDDPSDEVRLAAVRKLGELRERKAVTALLERYRRDEDRQVRYECLTSLGLIGDRAASSLLLGETRSQDPYVRMWAMGALCELGDDQAPSLATAFLRDPDANVREQVVRSCPRAFDTPDGHRTLIEFALATPEFQASVWARRNLAGYVRQAKGGEVAEEIRVAARGALDGPRAVRAALLLGDLGDRTATDRLIEALRDPDPFVRHHAAYLLSKTGERRAVPSLVEALNDPVELVAATASSSLEWFARDGDARAREALSRYTGKRVERPLPR